MTDNSIFQDKTMAVDAISDEIALLERKTGNGGQLDHDDLAVLMQCSIRLSRLVNALAKPDPVPSPEKTGYPRRSGAAALPKMPDHSSMHEMQQAG